MFLYFSTKLDLELDAGVKKMQIRIYNETSDNHFFWLNFCYCLPFGPY